MARLQSTDAPISGTDGTELYLAHRDVVLEVTACLCRRKGLTRADGEDFTSWAKVRLLERDADLLRRFSGRSSWKTYLTVVLANLLRDYQNARWGKWRPSATAKRTGPVAVELETRVRRDGMTVAAAVMSMRSRGHDLSDADAFRMLEDMPMRYRRRIEGEKSLMRLSTEETAADAFWRSQSEAEMAEGIDVLTEAIDSLPAEDRVILRLRFWEGLTVAQVSRTLGLNQKPLYRRIENLLQRLRGQLERNGIEARDALPWVT
jgi:RNA polymerase sigma factor for flagellar operon FliA